MHVLVRASVLVAVVTAVGSLDRGPDDPAPAVVSPAKAHGLDGLPAACGPHTVPEGDVCVPLPASAPPSAAPTDFTRQGSSETPDQILRLADRAAEWSAYALPLGAPGVAPDVLSRDQVAATAAPGASAALARNGVDFVATRGAPVRAIKIDHQEGDAEVLFVGDLFGPTVLTSHAVREGDHVLHVVLVFGHLERPADGLAAHAHVAEGAVIAYAGGDGGSGAAHVHLEARRVRDGVDLAKADPKRLVDSAFAVPTDPRNVLRPLH